MFKDCCREEMIFVRSPTFSVIAPALSSISVFESWGRKGMCKAKAFRCFCFQGEEKSKEKGNWEWDLKPWITYQVADHIYTICSDRHRLFFWRQMKQVGWRERGLWWLEQKNWGLTHVYINCLEKKKKKKKKLTNLCKVIFPHSVFHPDVEWVKVWHCGRWCTNYKTNNKTQGKGETKRLRRKGQRAWRGNRYYIRIRKNFLPLL